MCVCVCVCVCAGNNWGAGILMRIIKQATGVFNEPKILPMLEALGPEGVKVLDLCLCVSVSLVPLFFCSMFFDFMSLLHKHKLKRQKKCQLKLFYT